MSMSWISEAKTSSFWRAVVGEFLASILFIIMACGVTFGWNPPDNNHVSLSTGLGVTMLAHGFWDISGGQFNPAVAIACMVGRKISPLRGCFYIAAQIGGSLVGGGLLYAYTPSKLRAKFGVVYIRKGVTLAQGFFMEFTLTFLLIWTIFVSIEPRKKMPEYLAPLAIGLAVAVDLYIGIPYTGAAMNPIRALGPAAATNFWDDHWVYWIAPISSAVVTVLTYEFVFGMNKNEKDNSVDKNKNKDENDASNCVDKSNNIALEEKKAQNNTDAIAKV